MSLRLNRFHITISRQQIKDKAPAMARSAALTFFFLAFAGLAQAQSGGTIDMSGAQNLMNTMKTFVLFAGGVICLGSLIFTGIKLMSGNFAQAIPGFFGALFGAAVIGWGPGWITSLTGQSM